MNAIATKNGFYHGHLIRAGKEFALKKGDKINPSWMREVGAQVKTEEDVDGHEPSTFSEINERKPVTPQKAK